MDSETPVVVVTGGAAGIGLAFAQRWTADGGHAVLLDRNEDALAAAVETTHGRARGISCDITSEESLLASFESIEGLETRVDGLVNCAGAARPSASAHTSATEFTRMLDLHVTGTFRACRTAYHYLKSSRGSIVNISSVAAVSGMPQRASYCAAKSGIDGLTRTLAVEWAQDGIRVNSVAPGYVRTAMTGDLITEGKLDADPIVARTPLRRFAEPNEIGGAINFLLSKDASYITGHSLMVDGGMTIDGNWY